MVFSIILLVLGLALVALPFVLEWFFDGPDIPSIIAAFLGLILALTMAIMLPTNMVKAKTNKALMAEHLAHPTYYTYEQLADHNDFVTKAKVWQGTIFSFYNDTDLQTIDIDSVSNKVIVKQEEK